VSNYIPPDAHHVDLNFQDVLTGSTDLEFGSVDQNIAQIDVTLNTSTAADIYAESHENNQVDVAVSAAVIPDIQTISGQTVQIDLILNTAVNPNLIAVPVNQFCSIDIIINNSLSFESQAIGNINHILGVSLDASLGFDYSDTALGINDLPWSIPDFISRSNVINFDKSMSFGISKSMDFSAGRSLAIAVSLLHDVAAGLSKCAYSIWNETLRLRINKSILFDGSQNLSINKHSDWVDLIRRRKQFTFSHDVAEFFEKKISFDWDRGLELVTTDSIHWDAALPIHYRKHSIDLWPEPEIPQYSGSTDLNFVCSCHDIDSHDVVLNFGADDCIPSIPNKEWWHILNSLSVTRLDNGEEIQVMDGSYSTDRSSWCWSYSLTVPALEIEKLNSIAGQPVILKILVNGNEHQMLLESRTRSRKFARDTFNLSGRSQTALLDAPYSPTRSFLQENERTARQLCQAELDRVNSQVQLNWQLIDELSWILPINSLSYSNLTPIAVIKMIAESAGGFVYSEKNSSTLTIKPKYKKTFWDSIAVSDYDRLIPLSITVSQSIDDVLYPDYNGITLTNDRNGLTGQVRRSGTSADTLQETANNPLFTFESMGGYGKSVLAKAGMVESHTLSMPVESKVGECAPGELVAFDAEWWGISDSVAVSLTHAIVNQTIKVERVNHE